MTDWRRIASVLALSGVAIVVALGSAAGAEANFWGGTTPGQVYRNISFETSRGHGKAGRKGKFPTQVSKWGMGVPLSCDIASSDPHFTDYALLEDIPKTQGSDDPGTGGNGGKLRVRKRKHRFSHHEVFSKDYYGVPRRIEYTLRGRFRTPRRATGTVDLTTLWSFPDGVQMSCSAHSLTWSACDTHGILRYPPCGGRDPLEGIGDG